MSASPPTLLERARHGEGGAIATLIQQALPPVIATTKAILKDQDLYLRLESETASDAESVMAALEGAIATLNLPDLFQVKVYGWVIGEDFPQWQHTISLTQSSPSKPSWLGSVKSRLTTSWKRESQPLPEVPQPNSAIPPTESAELKPSNPERSNPELPELKASELKASELKASELRTEDSDGEESDLAMMPQTASWWNTMGNAVSTAVGSVGTAASQGGKAISNTLSATAVVVGHAASQSGQAMGSALSSAVETAGTLGEQTGRVLSDTGKGAVNALGYATDSLGQVVDKVDWLLPFVEKVDVEKAETIVRQLQAKHPQEDPRAIAHRIMLQKALYVTGTGAVSSFIPGMVVLDLATTTLIQAEMGYQIAAAYGLNLRDPARKGEILAIFGLALGGTHALRAGVALMRTVPLAGAVVGASTNAVALYTVGHAACQFYETLVQTSSDQALMAATENERDSYLQGAIAQQQYMDQILAHMVKASHPTLTWETVRPELERLNVSPVSIATLTAGTGDLPPLETLLAEVSQEFAVPLLAQCQAIAEADGQITEAESQILSTITQHLVTQQAVADSTEAAAPAVQSIRRKLLPFWKG